MALPIRRRINVYIIMIMILHAKTGFKWVLPQTEVHCSSQIHHIQDPRRSYLLRFRLEQTLPQKVHCQDVCLLSQALPCPEKDVKKKCLWRPKSSTLNALLLHGNETAIEGQFHGRWNTSNTVLWHNAIIGSSQLQKSISWHFNAS